MASSCRTDCIQSLFLTYRMHRQMYCLMWGDGVQPVRQNHFNHFLMSLTSIDGDMTFSFCCNVKMLRTRRWTRADGRKWKRLKNSKWINKWRSCDTCYNISEFSVLCMWLYLIWRTIRSEHQLMEVIKYNKRKKERWIAAAIACLTNQFKWNMWNDGRCHINLWI